MISGEENDITSMPSAEPLVYLQTCPFVLDLNGNILKCPEDLSDRLGIPVTEPIGKPLRTLLISIVPGWGDWIPENFAEEESSLYLPFGDTGNPFGVGAVLHRLIHGDTICATLSPDLGPADSLQKETLFDGSPQGEVFAQLFLRLQLSESRLNNYMRNFPGIFFCQRPDLSFTYIGPRLSKTLDTSVEAFYKNGGAFIAHIFEKDRPFFLKEIEKNSSRAKTFSFSYRFRRPNGSIVYVMDVRTPLFSPAGLLMGYEGVWLDISRQSIAENRLTSSAWKENLALITSGLVHDFSNMMAGIHSLSELYYEDLEEDSAMQKGMGQIKKSSQQAQKLVRRIIDLNREQSGMRDYHNIEKLIEDQSDLIRIIVPKPIEIQTELTQQELPVYIDDVAFRQLLLNLAINARDAMDSNKGGCVNIKVKKVVSGDRIFQGAASGSATIDKEGVEIHFSDTGCGIEETHLAKIFAPFFTTKEVNKGSGFGLYNARLFMENNKGRISVSSQAGEGTTFYLYLPLADFTELEKDLKAENADTFQYEKRRPSYAVYCQTDPGNFEIVNMMRQKGWEVICFRQHERLYHYLREAEFLPHCTLVIDIGHDMHTDHLLQMLNDDYPGIKTALQSNGRNPEEVEHKYQNKVDLLATDTSMNPTFIRKLDELVS